MFRGHEELIKCDVSDLGNGKAIAYVSVEADDFIRGYTTSVASARMIKEYYDSYNEILKKKYEEEQIRLKKIEEEQIRLKKLEEERIRIKELENEAKNKEIKEKIDTKEIDIDNLNGYEFEIFVGKIFEKMGYKVEVTQKSGDQGIDIIARNSIIKIGIQAKCYSQPVGNSAVQEAVAGKAYYNCDKVFVATNNTFTKSAMDLAKVNNVGLIDRFKLINMIKNNNLKI